MADIANAWMICGKYDHVAITRARSYVCLTPTIAQAVQTDNAMQNTVTGTVTML